MLKQGYKRYLDPQSKEDVPRKTKYRKRIEQYGKAERGKSIKVNYKLYSRLTINFF